MRTLLDDFAVIDDEDTVSIAYGLESVRYHNDGLVMGQLCDCLHQLFLILGVDIRRRLIEDDYGRVLHNCRAHLNFHKAGARLLVLNAARHGGDGQLVRRLACRRQKRHINAVYRHDWGFQKAPERRRHIPQPHGVLDKMPVLTDRREVTEHDGDGNSQLL